MTPTSNLREKREGNFVAGNAKKELVINNNTPHTPRKRGAEIASTENYNLALDLWRVVCTEAGIAFVVDNCTANGARKVAARYLDTNVLTPEAVKGAMRKLAYLITHSEKAQHYTLNALGNNISRYVVAVKKDTTPATPTRVLWDFVCNSCGANAAGFYPGGVQPKSAPCACHNCSGMMIPKKG